MADEIPPSTGSHSQDPSTGPQTGAEPVSDLDGQRAWLAQLDRRLGTRTWAGAALLVLALAAGIVAIVLTIDVRDNSATKADLDELQQQLTGVADQAESAGDLQQGLDSLSARLDSLEDEVNGLSGADSDAGDRLDVVEDDIEDLRQQISDLESAPTGGDAGSGNSSG